MMRKDHFKQKLILWPQVSFNEFSLCSYDLFFIYLLFSEQPIFVKLIFAFCFCSKFPRATLHWWSPFARNLPLYKIPKFYIISWCWNFVETHSFRRVSTKSLPHEIRWNYGFLCILLFTRWNSSIKFFAKSAIADQNDFSAVSYWHSLPREWSALNHLWGF